MKPEAPCDKDDLQYLKDILKELRQFPHYSEELMGLDRLLTITIITNEYGKEEDIVLWALVRLVTLWKGEFSAEDRKVIARQLHISVDTLNHRYHSFRCWVLRKIVELELQAFGDGVLQHLTHNP